MNTNRNDPNYLEFPNYIVEFTIPAGVEYPPVRRPYGVENCLTGMSFYFNGLFNNFSRRDMEGFAREYGGKVIRDAQFGNRINRVSRTRRYIIVVGRFPSDEVVNRAVGFGFETMTHRQFFDLINNSYDDEVLTDSEGSSENEQLADNE